MNEDQLRSMLHRTAQTGVTDDGGPDVARIARRVRGVRRRRTLTGVLGGVASVVLVAVVVWQVGGLDPDPAPPATPTSTVTTGDPTPTDETTQTEQPTDPTTASSPEDTPTETEEPAAAPWTPDMMPVCGEPFALPDGPHVLTVTTGPPGPVAPLGHWPAELTNPGGADVTGGTRGGPFTVVMSDGVVVATEDLGVPGSGGEGTPILGVAAGGSVSAPVSMPWACDGGELSAGEYEAFVLAPLATPDEDGSVPVGAGGPWPLTIATDGLDDPGLPPVGVEGGAPFADSCGAPWSAPEPATSVEIELLDQVRTPRSASDDVFGYYRLTSPAPMADVGLFEHVVLLQDGVQVSSELPANDDVARVFVSAGAALELIVSNSLTGCDGAPLPSGDYQLVVLQLMSVSGDQPHQVIALTEPVDVTLE